MHHLPEAPLHKSVIFLGDRTTVIGADFHISPNNWLLTLTFTLTLTCGAGTPVFTHCIIFGFFTGMCEILSAMFHFHFQHFLVTFAC